MKPNHQAAELQFCRKISEIASIWGSKEWWATPKCGKVWPFRWKWFENCWTTKSWSWYVMICIEASSFGVVWSQSRKIWFITCLLPFLQMDGDGLCCSGLLLCDLVIWIVQAQLKLTLRHLKEAPIGRYTGYRRVSAMWQVFFDQHQFSWSQSFQISTGCSWQLGLSEAYSFVCCISHHIPSYPCLKLRPFCAKANDAVRKGDRVPEACSRLPSTVFDSHSMSQRIGW